jgi:hypothetical protein
MDEIKVGDKVVLNGRHDEITGILVEIRDVPGMKRYVIDASFGKGTKILYSNDVVKA